MRQPQRWWVPEFQLGNLFHYSQQWAFSTIEDNWKNPRWLPVRYVYALHQIWSSVKWRFMTIFLSLFVYQNPIKQSMGKWMVSIFFSADLVLLCTLPEWGQGKVVILIFQHLLCVRVWDATTEGKRHDKNGIVCLWHLLLFCTLCSQTHIPSIYWHPKTQFCSCIEKCGDCACLSWVLCSLIEHQA